MTATPPPSEPTTGLAKRQQCDWAMQAITLAKSPLQETPVILDRLYDSALASQEARHRQEMEEAKREADEQRESADGWHRDFLAAEQREREAGGKLESLTGAMTSAASAVQGCIADHAMRCRVDACHDHQMFRNLKAAIGILDSALAAIRSAPSTVHTGFDPAAGDDYTVKASFPVPAAPSPVSAPPTRIRRTEADNARLVRGADEGEIALIVFAPGKPGEGGYASVDFGYEDGRFWASFGRFDPAHGFYPGEFVQIATLEELYREWDAALKEIARRKASPVEPGSDPPTAKGETGYYCDHEFVCRLCGFDSRFSVPGSDPQADQEACMRGSDGCQIKGRHSMCGTVLADPQEPETR